MKPGEEPEQTEEARGYYEFDLEIRMFEPMCAATAQDVLDDLDRRLRLNGIKHLKEFVTVRKLRQIGIVTRLKDDE